MDDDEHPHQSVTALERGLEAMHRGRLREAIAWFDRAVHAEPNDADALMNRAVAKLALNLNEGAMEDAARAVEIDGGPSSTLLQAMVQTRLGYYRLAEPSLQALREGEGVDQRAVLLLLSIVLTEQARGVEAVEMLQQYIDAFGGDAALFNGLGIALERAGEDERATNAYEAALDADPEHIETWRNFGMLMLNSGFHDEAARALERYLLLAPMGTLDREAVQSRLDRLRDQ